MITFNVNVAIILIVKKTPTTSHSTTEGVHKYYTSHKNTTVKLGRVWFGNKMDNLSSEGDNNVFQKSITESSLHFTSTFHQ